MKTTDEILMCLLAELDGRGVTIRNNTCPGYVPRHPTDAGPKVFGFAHHGIAWDASVLADRTLDDSEARAWTRALADLERRGFIQRVAPNGRTSHVRFTPDGLRRALEIVGTKADRASIALALRAAAWASADLLAVVQ